ncbi:MAG: hypothetical protein CBC79_05615 [Gammaproteobacteria bacterium TMED119]|nr:MAG: hypothetical protein CBC79_05615 [Gammaproteobacteria bacterium TMED119]RCL44416.1 MAG: energy transducer TonB [Candidatus Thioglobus sp.]
MRHKQSIIVTTIGLFIVLFIVVFTDNDEHVTPRSASFHFQHISIAEQPNENEQQTIKEPIEEQIEEAPEEDIVEQAVIEEPRVEQPIDAELIEVISKPVAVVTPAQEIAKAIVEPLNNTPPMSEHSATMTLPVDTVDLFDFEQLSVSYKQQLSAWLEKYKRYPAIAQRRAYQGIVVVKFSINNEGSLLNHEITQASKHSSLNNAVITMLKNATPMPAMPQELQTAVGYYEYEIPVRFELSDR